MERLGHRHVAGCRLILPPRDLSVDHGNDHVLLQSGSRGGGVPLDLIDDDPALFSEVERGGGLRREFLDGNADLLPHQLGIEETAFANEPKSDGPPLAVALHHQPDGLPSPGINQPAHKFNEAPRRLAVDLHNLIARPQPGLARGTFGFDGNYRERK